MWLPLGLTRGSHGQYLLECFERRVMADQNRIKRVKSKSTGIRPLSPLPPCEGNRPTVCHACRLLCPSESGVKHFVLQSSGKGEDQQEVGASRICDASHSYSEKSLLSVAIERSASNLHFMLL